ncbi:autotransporter domain-containing protein [Pandoraea pnomenusa]|uniref:autotransporter domain-containing protein n=1 Tax=Pandoraea pnomenusa TaxID=93220 RepID=UPI003342DEE9
MNRTYKTIYNRALNLWQVASEVTASRGKSGGKCLSPARECPTTGALSPWRWGIAGRGRRHVLVTMLSLCGATGVQAAAVETGDTITVGTDYIVGDTGVGTLSATPFGPFRYTNVIVGNMGTGNGTFVADGPGATVVTSGYMTVGNLGVGNLTLLNGSTLTVLGALSLGQNAGSTGILNIGAATANASDAVGAGMLNASTLSFGAGTGTLNFNHTDSAYVFGTVLTSNGSGTHKINQIAGTTFLTGNSPGFDGTLQASGGTLIIRSQLRVASAVVDGDGTSSGGPSVQVSGVGASWLSLGAITVGDANSGALSIQGGGTVIDTTGVVGFSAGSQGAVTVSGPGSTWTNNSMLSVGNGGAGTLTIQDGGTVTSASTNVGAASTAGVVKVTGNNSVLRTGTLSVGISGVGSVTVGDGGAVYVSGGSGAVGLGWYSMGVGVLNIGAASTKAADAVGAGLFSAPEIQMGAGLSLVNFNHTDSAYQFGAAFVSKGFGTHRINQIAGTTILTGDNVGFDGATTVSGGTLIAQGRLGGSASVTGGKLQFGNAGASATSNLSGNLPVSGAGSTLSVQGPAMLNVAGDVNLASHTVLDIDAASGTTPLQAAGMNIGSDVTFNLSGISDPTQLGKVLIATTNGINGDFGTLNVGGFSGPVNYLTVNTYKSNDNLRYLASYGLTWTAHNTLASGTFTLTNPTDTFWLGATLANQPANAATGWDGTSLTKNGAGTITLASPNTYTGPTTIDGGTLVIATTGGVTSNVLNRAAFVNAGTVAGSVTNASGATFTQTGGSVSGGLSNAGIVNANGGALDGGIANRAGAVFNVGGTVASDSAFANAAGATLSIAGSGDYTLAGLLTNSGSAVVDAGGSLTANAGIVNSGTFTNHGTVTDDLDNTGTYINTGTQNANVHSNTGTITNGAGALWNGSFVTSGTVNNDGTITGSLTQTSGTTTNTGTIGGLVTILGGTYAGTGTLGGLTTGGAATIAPGLTGVMNVNGNVTLGSGSIYRVSVDATGQSSRLSATGTATLNGATVAVLAGPGAYGATTTYTILSAAGGIAGTFSGVSADLAFLTPTLGYGPQDVTLTLDRNETRFADVARTRNQTASANAIELLGKGNPVWNAVVALNADTARSAFDQLSGEIHASTRTALIEDSHFVRDAALARMPSAACAASSASPASAVLRAGDVDPGCRPGQLASWARAFGSWGQTASDGNAARLRQSTGGFLLGADGDVADTVRVGALAGYSRTNFNVSDRHSSGASDNYHLGLYAGTAWGDLSVRSGAAFTWHDVSTRRGVAFSGYDDSLKAGYRATTTQAFAEIGYGAQAGAIRLEPFVNLAYVNLHTNGFTEQGGAAALSAQSANTGLAFSTLGVHGATQVDLGRVSVSVSGTLGWRHAYGAATPGARLAFAGAGTFDVAGVAIARDVAVIETGLTLAAGRNATVSVSYAGQFGSGQADNGVRANLRYAF